MTSIQWGRWLFIVSTSLVQVADPNAALLGRINGAIEEHRGDWVCSHFRSDGGVNPSNAPQGRGHHAECVSGERRLTMYLFIAETRQDAARRLALSQQALEINRSHPMTDVGEQGYEDMSELRAWIAFREDVVFAQVGVGFKPGASPVGRGSEHRNDELLSTAKHFGLLIVKVLRAA